MNTIHDMGGMHGFGRIVREAGEPVFHERWEARVFALAAAVPAVLPYNDDAFRPKIESLPPGEYLSSSYYELWYKALARIVLGSGAVSARELETGRAEPIPSGVTVLPVPKPAALLAAMEAGYSSRRATGKAPRFKVGDAVMTRNINPPTHTRLPRYARAKRGRVVADHGIMCFNDANGRGDGEQPQHVYTVLFTLRELWGPEASARDTLTLDLWDDHLEPA
jgi:nitrile hydratase